LFHSLDLTQRSVLEGTLFTPIDRVQYLIKLASNTDLCFCFQGFGTLITKYSDTSANEDNSYPESHSLAET